jgi:hypothetical protein
MTAHCHAVIHPQGGGTPRPCRRPVVCGGWCAQHHPAHAKARAEAWAQGRPARDAARAVRNAAQAERNRRARHFDDLVAAIRGLLDAFVVEGGPTYPAIRKRAVARAQASLRLARVTWEPRS